MVFDFLPLATTNTPLLIALLFMAGVVEDILDTWVTFTVVKRQTVTTALITFFGIILEFTVFLSFVSNLDKWYVIVSYALGAMVGTVGVIELQKRINRKKRQQQMQRKLRRAAKKKKVARKVERQTQKPDLKAEKKVMVEEKLVKSTDVRKEIITDAKTSHVVKSDTVKPSA